MGALLGVCRFGIIVNTFAPDRNSFATTGDGAAINKKLMSELRGFFLWCVCHLLALAVRDALPVRSPGQDASELPRASVVMHMAKQVQCACLGCCLLRMFAQAAQATSAKAHLFLSSLAVRLFPA